MSDPRPEQKTILVVDDSKSIRTLLRIYLRKLPLRVLFATDGVDALRVLSEDAPDVILMDLMMPRMDGLTLLEELNADEKLRKIPRIIVSSRRDEVSLQQALTKGVAGYLVKPVSMEHLEPLIREALEGNDRVESL